MKVYLAEDNAGGLLIGNREVGWWDVTFVQRESSFVEDAIAITENNTGDWTVDHYDDDEKIWDNFVAEYEDGTVKITGRLGNAALEYLRLTDVFTM